MRSIVYVLVSLVVTGSTRRVQTSSGAMTGAREWESENMIRYSKGEITDAELGLLNLKNAIHDPVVLKEMADGLRQPEGAAEMVKMMANPKFQEQAKRVVDNMKAKSVFPNFLRLEFYAKEQDSSKSLQSLLLAMNPVAATRSRTGSAQMSALGARKAAPKKSAAAKPVAKKTVAPKKAAPKKSAATKTVAKKTAAPKRAAPKKSVAFKTVPKRTAAPKRAAPKTSAADIVAARRAAARKKTAASVTAFKKQNLLFDAATLGGVTDPDANLFGFGNVDSLGLGYFDPWGFTIGASENKIRSYREAELKHARIAMLACLGFFVGETSPFKLTSEGEIIDGASVYALQKSFEINPQIWLMPLLIIAALESISAVATFRMSKDPSKTFELTADYTPGDVLAPLGVTFDPLGLAPKDPKQFEEMQTKELNNGRVAMLAILGFFAQEASTGQPIFG